MNKQLKRIKTIQPAFQAHIKVHYATKGSKQKPRPTILFIRQSASRPD